jgi:hypothetical protein
VSVSLKQGPLRNYQKKALLFGQLSEITVKQLLVRIAAIAMKIENYWDRRAFFY